MSLRALPLMAIPLILYNLLVMFSGGEATQFFATPLFKLPMIKGAEWVFTRGDLIILVTMLFLFAELVKATYTTSVSLIDHGLSMVVFIICIVEFLIVNSAATSPSVASTDAGHTCGRICKMRPSPANPD